MATARAFPSIKPTSRSYTPGNYPSTNFESLDGTKTHIRYGNKRVNATLSLGFSNITDAQAFQILENYRDVNSDWDYVTFNNESGLAGYWNFEEGSGNTVYDLTSNGNDGIINGATYDTIVPTQSCNLTNVSGCDSTAILNLTINSSNSSTINVTACDSYTWNDSTYTQSGTYYYNGSSNNYSIGFDGSPNQIIDFGQSINQSINNEMTIIFTVTPNQNAFVNGKWLFGQNENGSDWFGCRYDHVTGGENFIFRRYI